MPEPLTEPSRSPLVSIEAADVDIEGQPILRNITWQLLPGECLGIVGANGSGKSTLLRLIAGTIWPAPGRGRRLYDFGDGVRTDAIDARTRIVDVGPELQNRYARFGWNFRVIDIVRSGLSRTDIPRRNPSAEELQEAAEVLARLDLAGLAERRFLELSRGQQRRVLIARAIAFKPTVLVLDEPASGLDRSARQALDALLDTIAATIAIVVTAHSIDDLPPIVARFATLVDGRLGPEKTRAPAAAHGDGSVAAKRAARTRAGQRGVPLIEIRSASVYLGEQAILSDVHWSLADGEHWSITGPNGSGKSTFLRLLHGQIRPAVGGTIAWPGLGNPGNVWALRRRIGFVSAELQAAYRYRATAAECIGSGIDSSLGLTRQLDAAEERRVEELIDAFGLGGLRQRLLTALSYGQLHRVLIARTLVNRPRVLLLDEPWEGLDPSTRGLVTQQLHHAMAEGTQIVCASHVPSPDLGLTHHLSIRGGRINRDDAGA